MVELQLKAKRGVFQLEIECSLKSHWTVVFGPSGAGKSTLLRLIAGLDLPDAGRIAIHGQYVTNAAIGLNLRPGPHPGQRGVGLVAQYSALFPHLSIASNVGYGISGQDRKQHAIRVDEMLDLLGASHLIRRSPRQLSGGEAQRISLARALAPTPRLLLLDEPLSALDADARDQILTRLQSWLEERKIQTILVTHDAADALATEAEVALLHEGKLAALGPASVVLAAERNRLLARLQSK
jgi:ABC-type sulfate/molybdate transport systems ATPase subunit